VPATLHAVAVVEVALQLPGVGGNAAGLQHLRRRRVARERAQRALHLSVDEFALARDLSVRVKAQVRADALAVDERDLLAQSAVRAKAAVQSLLFAGRVDGAAAPLVRIREPGGV